MSHFPHIVTFYSFKGGVGRSMAVLNVAYALAAFGRSVIVLDMDLEAPGLTGFLKRNGELESSPPRDSIDLVGWALAEDYGYDPGFEDHAARVKPERLESGRPRMGKPGRVDVISIDESNDFYGRFVSLRLGDADQAKLVDAGKRIRNWLRKQTHQITYPPHWGMEPKWVPYDYVLVDSRTGATEVSGLCVGPLSDRMVVFSGLNDQNIEGTRRFLDEIGIVGVRDDSEKGWDDWDPPSSAKDVPPRLGPKPTLLVASPVPYAPISVYKERLGVFRKRLGQEAAKLTYHPQLALLETAFVREDAESSLSEQYFALARAILASADDQPKPWIHSAIPDVAKIIQTYVDELLRSVRVSPDVYVPIIRAIAQRMNPEKEDEFLTRDRLWEAVANGSEDADLAARSGSLSQWSEYGENQHLKWLRGEAARECMAKIPAAGVPKAIEAAFRLFTDPGSPANAQDDRANSNPAKLRAEALLLFADRLVWEGDADGALRIFRDECITAFDNIGDERSKALTMGKIADMLQAQGQMDEALRIRREEQLPVYERLDDVRSRAVTMGKIADVLQDRGDLDEALRIRREDQLPVYERLGDERSKAVTLRKIADIHIIRGETDIGLELLVNQCVPIAQKLDIARDLAVFKGRIADVLQAQGRVDEALRIFRDELLPAFERLGDVREKAVTMGRIADVLQDQGDVDGALRIRREKELPVYERLGDVQALIVTKAQIAKLLLDSGRTEERQTALRDLQLALERAHSLRLANEVRVIEQWLKAAQQS